jgi:hypothetical protein
MTKAVNPDDWGRMATTLGDQVKAMLEPLEGVCRYRERRSDDTATFDVTPGRKTALAFSVAIAPGGVNIDSSAFSIKELGIGQGDFALGIVDAILAGRLRQVRQMKANGKARVTKTFIFDQNGQLLFKNRKSGAMTALTRPVRTDRIRFSSYA